MRTLLLAIVLVGCVKENPDFCPNHPDDPRCGGTGSDAGTGSDGDMGMMDAPPDAPTCFGAAPFDICAMPPPTGDLTLSGSLDTDGAMCSATQLWSSSGQTPSCFIAAANITVMNLAVTGSRPLVLVATGEINVTGHVDAASHIATTTPTEGPGSLNPGTCGTFGAPAGVIPAGGGAGASLASDGGSGGDGGGGQNGTNAGGTKYAPFLATPPGTLRAGCRGQQGGAGMGSGGLGGFGGGALYLVSGARIVLGASAIINASGAGGDAGGKAAGGGGGGSGGMILVHAPAFEITNGAIVVANGGSGGTGGDKTGSGTGTRGNDPDPANPMTPAPGPTGAGGAGGAGFAVGSAAATGGNGLTDEGGGGGGGGGGYIQSNMALTNATVSPAANVVP
jgi:hypothetical protein